jgi:transposase-like protein
MPRERRRKQRVYPPEFRQQVIELVRAKQRSRHGILNRRAKRSATGCSRLIGIGERGPTPRRARSRRTLRLL